MTYAQEVRDCIEAIIENLDPKALLQIEGTLEQLKYYTDVRTQLIENLTEDIQKLKHNFERVMNDLDDDDEEEYTLRSPK
jgi:hypothetical protein